MKNVNVQKEGEVTQAVARAEVERLELSPLATVTESEHGYVLEADMPGVAERDLRVTVEHRTLTVEGENRVEVPDGAVLVMHEIAPLRYRGVYELPDRVDATAVKATLKNGVLRLELPAREEAKPRRIEVKAA